MERVGIIPVANLGDATAKALLVPPTGFGQLVIDSNNSNKLSWINSSGTVVVLAVV